jgi:hypothetical protein
VDLDSALLWAHAAATTSLAGLVWVVQVVVYPSFRLVGPTAAWPQVHAHHTRATATVVVLPWAVQGACLAALLLRRPDGVPLPLLLVTGVLAATTVVVTAASSVPLHGRLSQGYDDAVARRLVATNWLRTAAWTAGAGCSLLMVGLASTPPA